MDYERFAELLEQKFEGKYSITKEDYETNETPKIFCNTHQRYFYKKPHFILNRRQGCKDCSKEHKQKMQIRSQQPKNEIKASQGIDLIAKLLTIMEIPYHTEKTFDTLKSDKGGLLRYDFCLETKRILIEFDNEGHRRPVKVPNISVEAAKENFENIQKSDLLKTQWAEENGWVLLRYTSTNDIRAILINEVLLVKDLEISNATKTLH